MTTALITGASAGIGAAFARELAARQTNLVLVARSQDKLYQLAEQLKNQFSIQVEVIVQDLTQPAAVQTVCDTVRQKGLTVDLLVNNAGFGDYGEFTTRDLQRQLEMIQLNIAVLVELTYRFLSEMQQRKSGAIINVSSISAYQSLPYLSIYSSTKAFILSFTEALWAENQNTGVRIFTLCPGPTESDFFEAAKFPDSFSQNNLTPAAEVVKEALKALDSNQSNVVTGGLGNHIIVNSTRLLPRELLVSMVEKQFRPS